MSKKKSQTKVSHNSSVRTEVFRIVSKLTNTPLSDLDNSTVIGLGGANIADDYGLQGLIDRLNDFIQSRGGSDDLTSDDITLTSTMKDVVIAVQSKL
jgi:hypothetical protein